MHSSPGNRDYGKRLLPHVIDQAAKESPQRHYAMIPNSEKLSDGFRELNCQQFANAIHRTAWWLDAKLGPCETFKTMAYTGPKDIRYIILAVAAIKVTRKV
jgi:hypothetical protein